MDDLKLNLSIKKHMEYLILFLQNFEENYSNMQIHISYKQGVRTILLKVPLLLCNHKKEIKVANLIEYMDETRRISSNSR